jgi:hypothetical protein
MFPFPEREEAQSTINVKPEPTNMAVATISRQQVSEPYAASAVKSSTGAEQTSTSSPSVGETAIHLLSIHLILNLGSPPNLPPPKQ